MQRVHREESNGTIVPLFFLFDSTMISTHKPHIKIAIYDNENDVAMLHITSNLGNVTELLVDAPSFRQWMGGELIQRCLPELDLVTRELMISGMDPITQQEFFNMNEEES